jgi:5-methylcytosine-specific restriction protein B
MKYISVKSVVEAYKGFQDCMTNKSWGYLALLKGCNNSITPFVPYEINLDSVSNFLENIFNLSQAKRQYNSGRFLYVVFSNKWETYFNDQGKHIPNIYDIAVWAYRRDSFEDNVTIEDIIQKFAKEFNIPLSIVSKCFDTHAKNIEFVNSLYQESTLKIELKNIGVDVSKENIDAKRGCVVASPGEISRGPFIQTLYAGLEITDYVLILQSNYYSLYRKAKNSNNTKGRIKPNAHFLHISYLTALRTKPFMLLAGISGTGKSRIVRKLAQATVTEELQRANGYTGKDFANDRWTLHSPANFELIQVKPNWHNSMDVIGYLSNIPSPHYVFTPFIEFIVKAWQHPKVPFFLCLDEMNLAPVEEYFAEFLSAIESRSFEGGEYLTDPIIKPFNSFGEDVAKMMVNTLFPNFTAGDTESATTKIIKHFRIKGLTLPKNLIVIGTVNMDETTFSFSRKVLDRAMSVEMNEVNYDSFLNDTTDDDLKAIVQAFEENDDADLNALLVDRHIEAKEIIDELGDDAKFAIDYLKRINALLEGTPFKLGYRAANEALIYLQASNEFGHTDRIAALDNFTLMKILSRIEGDETKLKITDSGADKERIANASVNVDAAKQYGDLNILTALRNIITQMLGESGNTDVESNVTEETATESGEEMIFTEQEKKELQSIKKIDSMLSQLKRDHFVSFWN